MQRAGKMKIIIRLNHNFSFLIYLKKKKKTVDNEQQNEPSRLWSLEKKICNVMEPSLGRDLSVLLVTQSPAQGEKSQT